MFCLRHAPATSSRSGAPRRAVALGVVIACALAGCTQPRRQRDDDRVPVVLPAGGAVQSVHPALRLVPEEARRRVAQALEATGHFCVASPEEEPIAARLSVSVANAGHVDEAGDAAGAADAPEATVALELRLAYRPPLSSEDEMLIVEVSAVAGSGDAAFESALDAALAGLLGRIRERARTDDELVADLSSSDPDRRRAALDGLAGRRHPAAIPALLELLKDTDDRVAAGALTRLLAFDPPGMARRIIDQAEVRGLAFLLQAIHALGAIGGDEAEAYLYVLETGHADPRVHSAARSALESLQRRDVASTSAEENSGEVGEPAEAPPIVETTDSIETAETPAARTPEVDADR